MSDGWRGIEKSSEGMKTVKREKRSINKKSMFKKQRLHVDARYALLKKLTSLKVKRNCDKIMLNFCAGIRQRSRGKKIF